MPVYVYRCRQCGETQEELNTISERESNAPMCCGEQTIQKITAPILIAVDNMPSYRCPVTGDGVTSRKQRNYIMDKHNLIDANDFGPPPKEPPRESSKSDVMNWID